MILQNRNRHRDQKQNKTKLNGYQRRKGEK